MTILHYASAKFERLMSDLQEVVEEKQKVSRLQPVHSDA